MNARSLGLTLLAAGALLAFIGLTADAIGLGGSPGIGRLQGAMLVVGAVLAIVGALRLRKPGR